jgi:two-component system response regulator AtoC
MSRVLIVEDDVDSASMMAALVADAGFTVAAAHSLRDARRQLALEQPELVLLDLQLPDGSGLTLLDPPGHIANAQVVLITGHATVETSIQALRLGVADCLIKPLNVVQLEGILSRMIRPSALKAELSHLTEEWQRSGRFGHLWGRSAPMQRVYDQIARVSGTAVTVLVTGDSGTGKELVARTIHDLSHRRRAPFMAVNCGAISPHLMESEIFGHEKGSFTGAERQHLGFFERAHGGTLFLDEVTEMSPELQVKLLRVLETGTFMRVGSTVRQECDVRVIAATNRSPEEAVECGRLREDLYYRLAVFPIDLPPLRRRGDDIDLLANHFLADLNRAEGTHKRLLPEALVKLGLYRWPGNVRELRNVIQRVFVMTDGQTIGCEWLPTDGPTSAAQPSRADGADVLTIPLGTSMAEAERRLILATLHYYNNHKERAAAALGISLKTLYNRLKDYASGSNKPPASESSATSHVA